jgi:glucose-1-phosphate cytidylyltransferase
VKVVILAGGYGTRISEESYLRPKPMIEIGPNPILWHIMKYYSSFGFNEFIVCCGYKGYKIKNYFNHLSLYSATSVTLDLSGREKPRYCGETSEPWEVTIVDTGLGTDTGGRLKRIREYLSGERFLFTYGDGLSNVDINMLIASHESSPGRIVTATAIRPSGRFGVFHIKGDAVLSFKEKAEEDENWINGGFMVVENNVFDYIDGDQTSFERHSLFSIAQAGKMGVYKHTGFWQCMDTQRDKAVLEDLWVTGKAPWKIWQ